MIPQIAILILCLGAMFLTNDPSAQRRRWAPVLGLCSEPFWFWTTYEHRQWGIFISAFFYTAAWARGFYHAWLKRAPDLVIGDPPQTLRWHLFRGWGWQVSLHKWLKSDEDRALHDHRSDNISLILSPQGFTEELEGGRKVHRRAWVPYFRKAETPHRVEIPFPPVWSIWIRWPPRREWGFHCPKGWRCWQEFLGGDYSQPGSVSIKGRGCE